MFSNQISETKQNWVVLFAGNISTRHDQFQGASP